MCRIPTPYLREADQQPGINFCFAKLLLEHGCNVLLADLTLRPEASQLVSTYTTGSPRAAFQETDVTSWGALSRMFSAALTRFGGVDIVCPGAGIYDPAWSNFWHPPGSALSRDSEEGGRYASLDVNVVHPIRVAQLAILLFWRNESPGRSSAWCLSVPSRARRRICIRRFTSRGNML